MITSTSINAAFIAKLVHAANVAIATESYCEIQTSKGKSSVLVWVDKTDNTLRFTHASGQDVTSLCWRAVRHLVACPTVELTPVAAMVYPDAEQEPSSHAFLSFYLLFVVLVVHVALGVLSVGSAVLIGGFVVILSKLALPVLNVLKTPSRGFHESTLLGYSPRQREAIN